MVHLRLTGVSEDGRKLVLQSDAKVDFTVDVDDRLRAAVAGEWPAPGSDQAGTGQLERQMESTLRPRDIQARIRAGETPESVAQVAGTSVDKVMPYAAPVLAERAHVAQRAQRASIRRRRLSAVPADELPLGDDAIELVTEDPDPAVSQDRKKETAALGAEAPVEAYLDSADAPGSGEEGEQPSIDEVFEAESETAVSEEADSEDSRRHEPPSRKPVKKTRGRASVPSWDEIMFGGGSSQD